MKPFAGLPAVCNVMIWFALTVLPFTPPVGSVLFVGSAVSKLPIGVVTKAMAPFFVAMFIVLMFVTYIPWISLWLPRLLGL